MSNWRVLYRSGNISAGMWIGDGRVFFTVEGLIPDDVIGQDVELGLKIDDLKKILSQAEVYKKQGERSVV